jgi:hypothetical protein
MESLFNSKDVVDKLNNQRCKRRTSKSSLQTTSGAAYR